MFDLQSTSDAGGGPVSEIPRPKLTKKQRRAAKREAQRAEYARRKEAGQCVRCPANALADSLWCADCGPVALASAAKAARKRRRSLHAAGCCSQCGQPKKRSKTVIQMAAIASPARWHTEGRKAQRRAITEGDGRTRNRLVGRGVRGRMSRAAEDEQDMRDAQAELEAANRALAHAHSPEVKAMGELRARAVLLAALDRVDLAARFLVEILARHKYLR